MSQNPDYATMFAMSAAGLTEFGVRISPVRTHVIDLTPDLKLLLTSA